MSPLFSRPAAPAEGGVPVWLRPLGLLAGAGLLLSLVPVLAVGFYIHPFGDDYIFGVPAYAALQSGDSLLAALLNTVRVYWFGWQGTFTGVLAMELMPDAFLWRGYAATPFVMAGLLILSAGKLLHTGVCRWLGGSRWYWLPLWAGLSFLMVQCMPDPAQSLYWWNGAALYTLFFALMLLLMDRLANLSLAGGRPRRRRTLLAECAVLAVLVSGGNFVTGLLTGLLLGLYWLAVLIWDRPRWRGAALLLALYAAGFAVCLAAPGNRVRQGTGTGLSPADAILRSLEQGWDDLTGLATPVVWAVLLLLVPVLWKLSERAPIPFSWPLAAPVLAFLLLSAQNAPHFYTMGEAGPGRIRDIVYFFYLWMLLVSEFWVLGWLHRRWSGPGPRTLTACTALAAALLMVILWKNAPWLTAGKAAAALADGSLAQYHQLMLERETQYRDPDQARVYYAPAMGAQPRLVFVYSADDADPEAFPNIAPPNLCANEEVACRPDG